MGIGNTGSQKETYKPGSAKLSICDGVDIRYLIIWGGGVLSIIPCSTTGQFMILILDNCPRELNEQASCCE